MNERNNIRPQSRRRTKLNKLTKILILTLPILIVLAGISASAGAAYSYKFGASRKTMLAVEAYVANDGSQAKAGASIFDRNHDDGIEKVYEQVEYIFTYVTTGGDQRHIRIMLRSPTNGYAVGKADSSAGCGIGYLIKKIVKAYAYMEGYRLSNGARSYEGKLDVSATTSGPLPTMRSLPSPLSVAGTHG